MYVDQHRLRQLTSIVASVHKDQLSSSAPVVVMFTADWRASTGQEFGRQLRLKSINLPFSLYERYLWKTSCPGWKNMD